MKTEVNLDDVYAPSDDVVAKEIDGEIIIVPLSADIGGIEEALYTMNDTGKAIWDRLDGKNSLKDVVKKLSIEYKASSGEIEKDVIKLVEELLIKKMLVETL